MSIYAVEHPDSTMILITGDRDYAYLISTLRLRQQRVIVIGPSSQIHPSLIAHANQFLGWEDVIATFACITTTSRSLFDHDVGSRNSNSSDRQSESYLEGRAPSTSTTLNDKYPPLDSTLVDECIDSPEETPIVSKATSNSLDQCKPARDLTHSLIIA